MRIVRQSYEILRIPSYKEALEIFEIAGRTCYKSEPKEDAQEEFVRKCLQRQHDSLLEHLSATVRFITSRGTMAELTRHRMCVFHVESSRFVSYKDGIEVIEPSWEMSWSLPGPWQDAMRQCERSYTALIESGIAPQFARGVLPNDLKTVIVMTANFRQLRHIFKLRVRGDTGKPHPDIERLLRPLLEEVQETHNVFFEDI